MDELTLKQVQNTLHVSYQTLMTWLKEDQMDGHRINEGKRTVWRIPRDEVERIREERIQWHRDQIDLLKRNGNPT
jgi:predicted site-specific integrase-resolvase